ncbi:thymidylate synthase [Vibrio neptunius]|uniref:thymidylate synthase n=1 Tax=Vibrio neptunius TaxID=170651 RepID=UPI0006976EA9|nr:thymidylate synthase [Vibrio neptunius]
MELSKVLLSEAVARNTRGNRCYELPEPIIIKLENPTARIVTLEERHWPLQMGYAESLWLASGRNDLDFMSAYLKNLSNFSDDGVYIRGGYGPRIRAYNNSNEDYAVPSVERGENDGSTVDQLGYVIDCLSHESTSRRAIIEIGDPNKDLFSRGAMKKTLDFPCTRSLQFIINSEGKLDMYVHMRSNDFIWGMTGVNIFNFTFMQEYVSQILGVHLGSYYHVANNLHYYEHHKTMMDSLSCASFDYDYFEYNRDVFSFEEFNNKVRLLSNWETNIRLNKNHDLIDLKSDFMNDWQKVLYRHLTGNDCEFKNPILNYMR